MSTALLCMLLYAFQDRVMYIQTLKGCRLPEENAQGKRHPTELGLPCKDIYVKTSDGITLHGWLLKQRMPLECPTVVSLHGNTGNVGHRIPCVLEWYKQLGCNVLQIEYRSYGLSEGVAASEEGLIRDVEAFLKVDLGVDADNIILQGRSLGGAVAIAVAARFPDLVRALIVENTFLSIPTLVSEVPLIGPLRKIWLTHEWDSQKRASAITCPVLLIGGTNDVVTPFAHMEKLYDLLTNARWKRLVRIEGGTHNSSTHTDAVYISAVRSFIEDVLK